MQAFSEAFEQALSSVLEELDHPFTEVNISPKISISAQPLKMALYKNPAMHGSRIVIFLHESKKTGLFARLKALFLHDSKVNSLKPARYHIIHCIFFYFVFLGTAL